MHRPVSPVLLSALLSALLLAGCAAGPAYQRPAVPAAQYKEAASLPAWKYAEPADAAHRGQWWRIYGDTRLDELIEEAAKANQNILASEARYRQALALSDAARASLFPALNLNASVRRGSGSGTGNTGDNIATSRRLSLDASWEADLWGRVRNLADANALAADASAADHAAAILAVQSAVAQLYFQVRIADAQQRLLDDTVQAYERSLQLTQNRLRAGVATQGDVAQAQAQLKSTQAQALDNRVQRAQLEHTLAVLLGRTPSQFSLKPDPQPETGGRAISVKVPVVPAGLPSALLERRPDVAAAERRVAAANAGIGAAQAAIFPTLTLTASGGFQGTSSEWLSLPNRVWTLGPALAASLFDGGLRRAQVNNAIATYDATAAAYRQTVLGSIQEVEDALVSLAVLEQEADALDAAVQAARESEQQMLNRYQAGTVDYLGVVTVQTTALTAERNALTVLGRRLAASVALVKALGGGWGSGD